MKPTRPYECVCIVQIVEKCPITVRGLSPSCLLGFHGRKNTCTLPAKVLSDNVCIQ